MTNVTDTTPNQVIRQRLRDDDALLHGPGIGSGPSEIKACADLDRLYFNHLHSADTCAVVPETDGSTRDEPTGDPPTAAAWPDDEGVALLPIAAADLTAAATRLRPDPALTKALKRLLEGGWMYQEDSTGELAVTFDPRSKGSRGKPPKPYRTTALSCTCPGAIIRGGCYHPLAWQIATEAITPTTTIQCSLPSALFLPLCRLALASGAEHVTLSAETARGTLTLGAPDVAMGTVSVDVVTPVLLIIEQQVRTADLTRVVDVLAAVLPPAGDRLMLDLSTGSLLIIAGPEDAPLLVDGLDTLPIHVQDA